MGLGGDRGSFLSPGATNRLSSVHAFRPERCSSGQTYRRKSQGASKPPPVVDKRESLKIIEQVRSALRQKREKTCILEETMSGKTSYMNVQYALDIVAEGLLNFVHDF